jgi:NAD(P)-dependent dehydrogenase (short-subunit alcohol dehydrogenase family)
MTKEAVHANYLAAQKAEHAGKKPPDSRRALVVGSDRIKGNIGSAIAERLEADGFHEVLDPPMIECNVTVVGDVRQVVGNFAGIDTLVLANGYTHMDWIENYDMAEMYRVINCNLIGSMNATREFVEETVEDPWHKHIVYIGSMAAKGVLNASAPYCAAKAGLNHFARCMGWELTPKGYSVFVVNPSNTEGTPMTESTIRQIMRYRAMSREEAEGYWASINLKKHWLRPADVADAVSYLVSGRAAYSSGSALDLNGGQR